MPFSSNGYTLKMEFKSFLLVVATLIMGFVSLSSAYQFHVGGKLGWLPHPSEDYNHWAERSRFQVNDTLLFKYNKGSDSVLVVGKDEYYSCNTTNPILSLTDGDSVFKFDRSGPFFFISGNADHCHNGQRLIVVVLAVRHPPPPKAPEREDVINTTSLSAAPAPAPNGSAATSVSLILSAVCVGVMGMVFW